MFSPPTLVNLFNLRSEAESDLSHVNIEMLLDLMFHRGSTSSPVSRKNCAPSEQNTLSNNVVSSIIECVELSVARSGCADR